MSSTTTSRHHKKKRSRVSLHAMPENASFDGPVTHLRLERALEGEHVAERGEDACHDYCRRTACGVADGFDARRGGPMETYPLET